MIASVFTKSFLMLFSGPIVWAAHFLLIYGFTGVLCARPAWNIEWLGIGFIEWGVGVVGIAAIAVIAFIHAGQWRTDVRESNVAFVRWTGTGLAILSALAIVYETLPIFLIPACA